MLLNNTEGESLSLCSLSTKFLKVCGLNDEQLSSKFESCVISPDSSLTHLVHKLRKKKIDNEHKLKDSPSILSNNIDGNKSNSCCAQKIMACEM